MSRVFQAAVSGAALLSFAGQALAQTAAAPSVSPPVIASPPPASQPAVAPEKPVGSVFVRCDGQPAGLSGAELAGLLFLITATGGVVGGLVGAPETADDGKKAKGDEGVAACTAALAEEKEEIRRVQLTLARAIHQIEAKHYDAALADARSVSAAAPVKSQERGFQHSLGLSALEIEAATLLRMGRPKEAEDKALKMAATSPWDILNLLRVSRYVGLTAEMSPAKQAFYDTYIRVLPTGLFQRYEAKQWVGDWAGSAADLELLLAVQSDLLKEDIPSPPLFTARRSVAYLLAGDLETSNALAVEGRKAVDDLVKSGKALDEQSAISQAEELLDFQAAGRMFAEGKIKEARAAFAARSRWLAPTAPAVALMTARLRAGATPAELTGALARDPDQLRADALTAEAGQITESETAAKVLYAAIRPYARATDYSAYTRSVWNTAKSRYMVKRSGKENHDGELIFIYGASGPAGGEAMLLHAALVAQARGKDGFMFGPTRKRLDSALIIFGDKGDPAIEDGALINAADVINALSPDMPKPAPRR